MPEKKKSKGNKLHLDSEHFYNLPVLNKKETNLMC